MLRLELEDLSGQIAVRSRDVNRMILLTKTTPLDITRDRD
jgi:hypothetical protein